MQILNNPISALNVCESPKFLGLKGNRGRGTRWWRQILDRKWKYGRFAHAQWKICIIALIYGRIAQIFASFRKSGSRNRMVTSDFSPEVEIRPFRACTMHPAIIIGTVRSLWTWLAIGQIPRSTERISSWGGILNYLHTPIGYYVYCTGGGDSFIFSQMWRH